MAAAIVHDVGHGPFSHAFEIVGKRLGFKLAHHHVMSGELIRNGEIAEILNKGIMDGFAANVAEMVTKEGKTTLHNSVVSSQFDADRLDYMQRDRLMSGSQHSAIDLAWLLANLDVGEVSFGVDNTEVGRIPTFVIGPKAVHAAEAYVIGLFLLYPTIYFHKATRGAEKLFAELLVRVVELVGDSSLERTGIPMNHPLIRFAQKPDALESVLELDDTVVWGSLQLMKEATDPLLSVMAKRLLERNLYKCFDIRAKVTHMCDPHNEGDLKNLKKIERCCASVVVKLQEWEDKNKGDAPRVITDVDQRDPYIAGGPTERINVRTDGGELIDLSQRSKIVKSLSKYRLTRAYYDADDDKAIQAIKDIVKGEVN